MKKKWITLLVVAGLAAAMAGCGANGADKASGDAAQQTQAGDKTTVSTRDYDVESLVTVGDYSGLEVAVDNYIFSEKDVDQQMNDEFLSFVNYLDLYDYTPTDKDTIETGDVVNLDYCGKKDGVAFDGGTAQGAHLEIGSKSFIDGFEDGMIGHKVGDSFDLPLTFPEGYSNEELAGQDVIFEIKVNSIDDRNDPKMTDELIAGMGMEYQTVAEYRDYIKNNLQQACDNQNQDVSEKAVWKAVYEICEVKDVPQELIDESKKRVQENAQRYADYYGVSLEEFVMQNTGGSMEDFEAQMQQSSEDAAKEQLVFAAIAKKAGIELTDEEVQASAAEEFANYGYSSVDDMYADIGSGPYYDYILQKKVNEYLLEKVKTKNGTTISILELMN